MSSSFPENELVYRPLPSIVMNNFHPGMASAAVLMDPTIPPTQKALLVGIVQQAAQQDNSSPSFTSHDLVKATVGAGLGYAAAKATAGALSTVFSLSPQAQMTMAIIGGVGGMLRSTGIWR